MTYPSYKEVADALLLDIFKNGGLGHEVRALDVYDRLADEFELTTTQREATRDDVFQDGHSGRAWHNRVQWARRQLKKEGLLDSSQHGHWQLTEAGVLRARSSLQR